MTIEFTPSDSDNTAIDDDPCVCGHSIYDHDFCYHSDIGETEHLDCKFSKCECEEYEPEWACEGPE